MDIDAEVRAANDFFAVRGIGRDEYLSSLFTVLIPTWQGALSPTPHMPMWMMIDHYWDHARQTYAAVPRIIQAIEHKLEEPVLHNPGEWFTLACAAYLHDAGMSCPHSEVEQFRQTALGEVRNQDCELISADARGRVQKECASGIIGPSTIRKLHADIGAWRVARAANPLMAHNGGWARIVAKVVGLHRRGADRRNAGVEENDTYPFHGDEQMAKIYPIRVGVLASLLALSDGCQIGSGWVRDLEQIEAKAAEVREEIRKLDQPTPELEGLLRAQNTHYLMHRTVRRVHMLPEMVVIEPVSLDDQWLDQAPAPLLDGAPAESHRDLIALAQTMVRDELESCRAELVELVGKGDVLPEEVAVLGGDNEADLRTRIEEWLSLPLIGDTASLGGLLDVDYSAGTLDQDPDPYADICRRSLCDGFPLLVQRRHIHHAWPRKAFEVLYLKHPVIIKVERSGLHTLQIQLDGQEWGVYNNRGKNLMLREMVPQNRAEDAYRLSDEIHQALLSREPTVKVVDPVEFPLRWASGGIIPFPRLGGKLYCALFFRDIAPIGWNVANGASERDREWRSPATYLMKREFGEEMMVVERFAVDSGTETIRVRQRLPLLDGIIPPWHDPDREVWKQYSSRHRDLRREQDGLLVVDSREGFSYFPFHNALGTVEVKDTSMPDDGPGTCQNVVFSINPTELGIEVLWPVEFSLGPGDTLLDGEILEDRQSLVRRPVLLLSVDYLRGIWQREHMIGNPCRESGREDGRLLPEIPPEHYRLYDDDISLRQRLIRRAEVEPTWAKQHRKVIDMATKWLKEYAGAFEPLQKGDTIQDARLRTLCPVSWKALEVLFAHDCIPKE
ncbi:hypothetical protein LLH03_01110 [bacterium]|nr:hypothetical protein [bacterium]